MRRGRLRPEDIFSGAWAAGYVCGRTVSAGRERYGRA
jgi:hypothetical protein